MMRGILRLVRVSSFATAPSDVLAGYFLVASLDSPVPAGSLGALCAASLLLYWGGLIFNDVRDRDDDSRWRPERPLPAGEVTVGAARGLAVAAYGTAWAVTWCVGPVAVGLATAITVVSVAYSAILKRSAWGAAVGMGSCRVLVFLLGASVDGSSSREVPLLASVSALYFAYIAAITLVARGESESRPRGVGVRIALGAALLPVPVGAIFWFASPASAILRVAALGPLVALATMLAHGGIRRVRVGTPAATQSWVRDGVLGILLWNAGLLLGSGQPLLGGAAVVFFFGSRAISRLFGPS